jgi:CBS domain-containing protein
MTMKVKDIMTADVRACAPDTTVAEAAQLMWDGDCGVLPVVDDGELIAVATDRDMYIALATRNERASQVRVGAIAMGTPVTCSPEDDVQAALATMREARVRRLPVVGFGNALLGILSMNDIVMAAGARGDIAHEDVVRTLQAICGHHHPAPHVVAA